MSSIADRWIKVQLETDPWIYKVKVIGENLNELGLGENGIDRIEEKCLKGISLKKNR